MLNRTPDVFFFIAPLQLAQEVKAHSITDFELHVVATSNVIIIDTLSLA